MSKQIEALKMAIDDAIKFVITLNGYEDAIQSKQFKTEADRYVSHAIPVIKFLATSLQEALAEAEKQEWQSLSDGEIGKVLDDLDIGAAHTDWMINFAYAIEAKLKEKNGMG